MSEDSNTIKNLLKDAKEGDLEAMFELGKARQHGSLGLKKSFKKAARWYKEPAHMEHPKAQNNLGNMLNYGDGLPRDVERAKALYRSAADKGLVEAQFNLGITLNAEEDFAGAIKWFKKAAESNFARAQEWLGVLHYNGQGVEKDEETATDYFISAAQNGYNRAILALREIFTDIEDSGLFKKCGDLDFQNEEPSEADKKLLSMALKIIGFYIEYKNMGTSLPAQRAAAEFDNNPT